MNDLHDESRRVSESLHWKGAAMTLNEAKKMMRHLLAAEGYLQLSMPASALTELERVQTTGPLEAVTHLLRGEALEAQERYDDAITSLQQAANLFPEPFNQRALLDLGRCYRAQGREQLATEIEAKAAPLSGPNGEPVSLQVVLIPLMPEQTKLEGSRFRRDLLDE